MATFTASVTAAFTVTEVLEHARNLADELDEAEAMIDNPSSEVVQMWEITNFWKTLGNAAWVPRLIGIEYQRKFESLFSETRLALHRSMLVAREDSITAITPGIVTSLRERVNSKMTATERESNGRWSSLSDLVLWRELEQEGVVDYAFRHVKPGFELRGCAQCGRWYEPQISKRSRFCTPECRKRFNNMRTSAKDGVRLFMCGNCTEGRSLEQFSGLANPHYQEVEVSPLRISSYSARAPWCVTCVEAEHKEWAHYIAPIVDARERAAL